MKKIKIVYLVTFIKNSGVYNLVSNLLNEIDKEKYEVTIVSFLNSNNINEVKRLESIGIKYVSLNLKNKIDVVIRGISKLKKQLNILKPDIVHSNAIIADCALANIKGDFKKITTIHCNLYEDYIYTYGKIIGNIYIYIHLKALKHFNIIVGCSKSVWESLKNKFKNCKYIINGIKKTDINENNRQLIRDKLNLKNDDIVYIYIGNLSIGKNIYYLIEQFNKYHLNNEHMLVIGDGKMSQECKKIADNNIHFLGFCNDSGEYLNVSDVYVSASKSEGMAISVIESMERGLLLLLSEIPSHKEIFQNSKDIYLGEMFNENNFENAIKEIRKNIANRDKEKIINYKEKNFSSKIMYEEYENLYIELYDKK